jgi:Tat protein secretion system quality control protein TatD with DNase activity
MLIDTHVHLDQIESVERVIQTTRQADLGIIIAVNKNTVSNHKVLAPADQFANIVYPAVGYHRQCRKIFRYLDKWIKL